MSEPICKYRVVKKMPDQWWVVVSGNADEIQEEIPKISGVSVILKPEPVRPDWFSVGISASHDFETVVSEIESAGRLDKIPAVFVEAFRDDMPLPVGAPDQPPDGGEPIRRRRG